MGSLGEFINCHRDCTTIEEISIIASIEAPKYKAMPNDFRIRLRHRSKCGSSPRLQALYLFATPAQQLGVFPTLLLFPRGPIRILILAQGGSRLSLQGSVSFTVEPHLSLTGGRTRLNFWVIINR